MAAGWTEPSKAHAVTIGEARETTLSIERDVDIEVDTVVKVGSVMDIALDPVTIRFETDRFGGIEGRSVGDVASIETVFKDVASASKVLSGDVTSTDKGLIDVASIDMGVKDVTPGTERSRFVLSRTDVSGDRGAGEVAGIDMGTSDVAATASGAEEREKRNVCWVDMGIGKLASAMSVSGHTTERDVASRITATGDVTSNVSRDEIANLVGSIDLGDVISSKVGSRVATSSIEVSRGRVAGVVDSIDIGPVVVAPSSPVSKETAPRVVASRGREVRAAESKDRVLKVVKLRSTGSSDVGLRDATSKDAVLSDIGSRIVVSKDTVSKGGEAADGEFRDVRRSNVAWKDSASSGVSDAIAAVGNDPMDSIDIDLRETTLVSEAAGIMDARGTEYADPREASGHLLTHTKGLAAMVGDEFNLMDEEPSILSGTEISRLLRMLTDDERSNDDVVKMMVGMRAAAIDDIWLLWDEFGKEDDSPGDREA